jgi:hypothetical protein
MGRSAKMMKRPTQKQRTVTKMVKAASKPLVVEKAAAAPDATESAAAAGRKKRKTLRAKVDKVRIV